MKTQVSGARGYRTGQGLVAVLLAGLVMLAGNPAWAACSADYAGLASINEVSDKDQFIEVKILSELIDASVYSGWTLDFCSTDGKNEPTIECRYDLSLSTADDSGVPWLVIETAAVDLTGMDIRLKDENESTIDFVRVGNGADDALDNRRVSDPDCGAAELPYDTQLDIVGGQSGQFARRTPDGTGDWAMESGASGGKSTENTTNDGGGGGPGIRVSNVSIFQGEIAEFTVIMESSGTTDITIDYVTRDVTAVAGTDYSAVSGKLTIPAGMSGLIQVPTLITGSTASKRFLLELSNPRDNNGEPFGRLTSQIGVGTVLPEPLVIYRMEQSVWSGELGEVLDTSGNGRHATAFAGAASGQALPAIPGNPGTCRYGEFDGANDQLRDPDAGDYLNGLEAVTVMAWVYNSAALAGNDRGIFFTDTPGSGRDNRFGLRYDTDGFFGGEKNVIKASISSADCNANEECLQVETAGNVMVRNDWQHVAMTWELGRSIKVFVDGVEVGLSASSGTGGKQALARIERLDIGQGAKNQSWQGRIDEFQIFGAALSADKIDQKRRQAFPCSIGPDHIRLTHSGSGLTCSPSDITATACADADCTNLFPDPVTIDFSSPSGIWSPTPVTFTETTEVSLQYAKAEAVLLGAEASSPLAASATRCFSGGVETCEMTFLDSGFVIHVPDHTSAVAVEGTIAAVRKDETTQQCIPGFSNVTRAVALWSTFSDPDSGTESLVIDAQQIAKLSPGTVTSLDFDADGIATFDLTYPDVGRVGLNARYEGGESNGDAELVLTGGADFIVRPARFRLEVPDNPEATDASGDVFRAAGERFDAIVSALNANGDLTPNFGQETAAESVRLESSLVMPSGGENPPVDGEFGTFGQACDGTRAPYGTACGEFSWPEVGIIALTPHLAGSDGYLGSEDVLSPTPTKVGRFIPAGFDLIVTEQGIVEPFCKVDIIDFAYTGQSLNWQTNFEPTVTAEALNVAGGVTMNYTSGDFLKLDSLSLERTPAANDATALDTRGSPFPVTATLAEMTLSNLGAGRVEYRFSGSDHLLYDKTMASRVASFTPDYSIELSRLEDSDGVTASVQTPFDVTPSFGFQMRYGRLAMDNVYGPENIAGLNMSFSAEYWEGGRFLLNEADYCSLWNTADITGTNDHHSLQPDAGTVTGGTGGPLVLEPNGTQGTDTLILDVDDWLKDFWNGSATLENPSALATFGVYRGHDRVIDWRER